jgi:hypothetical protein
VLLNYEHGGDAMKRARRNLVVLALAAGSALVGMASPAAAAAGPNAAGTNCHGVVLSYFSTSGMTPGLLHQQFGVSVKDVQADADVICSL